MPAAVPEPDDAITVSVVGCGSALTTAEVHETPSIVADIALLEGFDAVGAGSLAEHAIPASRDSQAPSLVVVRTLLRADRPNDSELSCAAEGPHYLMLVRNDGARNVLTPPRTATAPILC